MKIEQSSYYLLGKYQKYAEQHNPEIEAYPEKEQLLDLFEDKETVYRIARKYSLLSDGDYYKKVIDTCWNDFLGKEKEDFEEDESRHRTATGVRRLDFILRAAKKIKENRDLYPFFSVKVTTPAYVKYFESLKMLNACCIGLCFSPQDIFAVRSDLISYVKTFGEIPEETSFTGANILIEQYGSWAKVIKDLNLPRLITLEKKSRDEKDEEKKRYLIEQIWLKAKELGRQPRFTDMEVGTTIQRTFGSWNAALIAAGYTPYVKDFNAWDMIKTNGELELLLVEETERLNRLPLAREFKHTGVVLKRYKKWSTFLKIVHRKYPILWEYPTKRKAFTMIPQEEFSSMSKQTSEFYRRFLDSSLT